MKNFARGLAAWKGWDAVWGLMVLLLPLTSVPIIVKLVHSDVVAAPSALILPVILVGWALPALILGKKFPDNAKPLILFFLAALLMTAVSFFRVIPEYKNNSPLSASLSAIITLGIGVCFYLVSLLRHDSSERLAFTFRLLTISGAVVCLWTLLQAFCWYKDQRYPEWMKTVQFAVSIGSLYRQRFVGFTLEPSWLAHQLNLLYLPWWFAASVTGYSGFRFRWKFLTVERICLPVGILVLFLTLSRVGLMAFLLTVCFCAAVLVHRLIRSRAKSRAAAFGMYLGVFLGIVLCGWIILRLLMKLDFRMAGLFDIQWKGRSDAVLYLAEKLSLAARFVYWDGGLSVFNAYPLTGVGLGHAGFYLPTMLNDYAYRLIEVQDLLYHSNTLLNIKSLWIRVLAETGIVGFAFFFIWYLKHLLGSAARLNAPLPVSRTAAWMGCFALIAFIPEGFSLDTFALPYVWFSAGIAAAGSLLKECDS